MENNVVCDLLVDELLMVVINRIKTTNGLEFSSCNNIEELSRLLDDEKKARAIMLQPTGKTS